jgi:hypothetical protein
MKRQPPEFLANIYRDLRDRSLLLPAGLLVAALIAVPVLLSESPSPPPTPSQTTEIEATAATPAVLAEQVGVRNYRKRLKQLKQKNPFDQQFTGLGSPELLDLELGDLDGGGSGGSSGSDALAGGDGGDAPTGTGSTSARPEPAEPTGQPQPVEARWFTWEADLAFGPVGESERFEGVRPMEFLPQRNAAIAVMAGVGLQGNRAGFMFLPDVVGSKGDGRCAPGPRNCVFLLLKKKQQHRVTVVTPDGEEVTYRIKVHDIVRAQFNPSEGLSEGADE